LKHCANLCTLTARCSHRNNSLLQPQHSGNMLSFRPFWYC